ncbi:MAG: recombinase family protein [Burkholderiales bacterium]|nr:recombinase family protein [Burkholderiales bacterium]
MITATTTAPIASKLAAPSTAAPGQQIGYTRVSTITQNTEGQLVGVDLARTFEDKASGKDTKRPQLAACMAHLRSGDTLHVNSMDRLARNLDDLRRIMDSLTGRGVTVVFHREAMRFEPITADMERGRADMARLMLSIMGAVAEFERSLILERQREGIAIAKQAGKYRGRKPSLSDAQAQELRSRVAAGESKVALAKAFGISRETVYGYLRG